METYHFIGIVLPERALLTLNFNAELVHPTTRRKLIARANILLNHVSVFIEAHEQWQSDDLRNIAEHFVRSQLHLFGYLRGFAYDLELTRVINTKLGVDRVFGIDTPCISERIKPEDVDAALHRIRLKTGGDKGIYLNRCFGDLTSAMKRADDTAFYCYRAIEALRLHCAAMHSLSDQPKPQQWSKFREVTKCDEASIREIKVAADPLRHGDLSGASGEDRARTMTITWDIVDSYLSSL